MFIRIDFTEKGVIHLTENGVRTKTLSYSDAKEYEKAYCDLLREIWDSGCREIMVMTKPPDYKDYDALIMPAALFKDEEGKVIAEYINRNVWNYVR